MAMPRQEFLFTLLTEAVLFLQLGILVGVADIAGAVFLCAMREAEGVEQFVDGHLIGYNFSRIIHSSVIFFLVEGCVCIPISHSSRRCDIIIQW